MTLMSRLVARLLKLPPAETYEVDVQKNMPIPMPDGVILLADHYTPRSLSRRPTLPMMAPYRSTRHNEFFNRLYAERGFQVLAVSSRGAEGSGGQLDPFRQERADAQAVVAWLAQQDWFTGELVASGPSYLGFTSWAFAAAAGPMLKALSAQLTSADFRSMWYPGDALFLDGVLGWISVIAHPGSRPADGARKLKKLMTHLPLKALDALAFGTSYPIWHDILAHEQPGDPWWNPADFRQEIQQITASTHLLSGWYDFMLPALLRDYAALVRAGRQPFLTVGPWTHFGGAAAPVRANEEMLWLREHTLGGPRLREMPVHLYVMGVNEWRDLPSFPPPGVRPQRWYLQPEGALAPTLPPTSSPDRYRYDPSDPTPSVGGAGIGTEPERQDNRALEARPDVLTFTSPALERDLEVIGPVSAELFVRSSLEHTDFFVRITDVESSGKSMNVCDGLQRLAPGRPVPQSDGYLKVNIELWPTAYRFHCGHRLRIQVSSGAFPRWNRNLGTDEPLATATTMRVAEQQVYHDPEHPSHVLLPVMAGS
ncbi:MAG: CocE/NonD family hydrolase [Ktedonobacteraceae bacterium]|nr:CocE/NonD family hydrolase [Ktedonobacteraceae bacterium]